jgi:hypothetical protein
METTTQATRREAPAVKGKMVDDSNLIGAAGIGLISLRAAQMKQVFHERHIDPGIDGTIELRDPATGEMTNQHIFVQSKASNNAFPGENDSGFYFLCDPRDLDYWLKASSPVIIICSHPETEEAWWAHVQGWFGADPTRRESRRIDFDKDTNKFDRDALDALLAIVDPHANAHSPGPLRKDETLVSNLLPVEFPPRYFTSSVTAKTTFRSIYEAQRATGLPVRSDFFLSHGRLYTWEPIADTALATIASDGSDENPIGELLAGDEDSRRLLVRLLSAGLQHDLRDLCRWQNDRKLIHVRPTTDLSDLRILSASGRRRIAFKGYSQRKDESGLKGYYRHAALRWRFIEVDGDWFCELRPDYFFSSDGYRESRYADEKLAGIKRLDKQRAVLGETELWAGILAGDPAEDRLDIDVEEEPRILTFGELLRFPVEYGIRDQDWKAAGDLDLADDEDQLSFDLGGDEA